MGFLVKPLSIDIELYHSKLFIFYKPVREDVKRFTKKNGMVDLGDDVDSFDIDNYCGICLHYGNDIIIFLNDIDLGIFIHELYHAVRNVTAMCGVEDEEASAYLLE